MGNWRSVELVGTCDPDEVEALHRACLHDWEGVGREDEDSWHALSYGVKPSLCGLHGWPAEEIHAWGNLAERDFGVESVREALERLARAAPSLHLKVHCGGDYEDKTCIATVTLEGGKAITGPPEIQKVREKSDGDITLNLLKALGALA